MWPMGIMMMFYQNQPEVDFELMSNHGGLKTNLSCTVEMLLKYDCCKFSLF